MEDYVDRSPRMGASVMIAARWYKFEPARRHKFTLSRPFAHKSHVSLDGHASDSPAVFDGQQKAIGKSVAR